MINHLSITSDIDQAIKQVGRFYARQIPFAASVALNKTAVNVQRVDQSAAKRDLDNPTPQTIRGIRVMRSSKNKLESRVFIIPAIGKFMRYQIHGGQRPPRGATEAVPFQAGVSFKLNQYGNIPGRKAGKLRKLLARPDTFSGTIKGIAGIWQRGKGANRRKVKLLLAYEQRTNYSQKYDFYGYSSKTAASRWPRHFANAIRSAIVTAK